MKKFFNKKPSSTPTSGSDNPYASPPPGDNPYAQASQQDDPYSSMRPGLPSGPKRPGAPGGLPSNPGARFGSPAPSPTPSSGGYGAGGYGASGGYGSNRYDDQARGGSRGPGGYGGLGRADSFETGTTLVDDDDQSRDNLFGGARERAQQQQKQDDDGSKQQRSYSAYPGPGGAAPPDTGARNELFGSARERYEQSQSAGRYGGGGGGDDDSYGGYGAPRELTAEEEEEQEVADTKQRIRELKQESAASSARSLAAGQAALEASRSTMARLGAQGDRLHNTEKNLDLAANHNKVAQERTTKLKSLNRSMFAVHVDNPFGANARRERKEEELLERHRQERDIREQTRREGLQSNNRVDQAMKDMSLSGDRPQHQRNLAARSKYQFEADSDDDDLEDQIDDNITQLETVTKGLHQAGLAIGRELDSQNKLIERIGQKSDAVDDQVRLNRDRLARIK